MYLETITVSNFRSFDRIEIPLCKDLTVLVGENNSGKSNALDAIRLITTPLGGRREVYAELTDIRFGSVERRFEIEALFSDLSPPQQGRMLSAATDQSLQSAKFGLTYDASGNSYPIRPTLWAGKLRGSPEAGCHEMIRHVYLPPLRDAKRALASGNPTRIYALLKHFLGKDEPDEVAKRLARATHPNLGKIDEAVDIGLNTLTSGVRQQVASLGFGNDEKLIDIARDLRFKLADRGIEPEDLGYSGHGYANLLYMATIAVELEKVNNADLTLFLVEEPEAHLHPQLQAAVLSFLEGQAEKSKIEKPGNKGPAGQIQVLVATHSPNLSAWVESKKLVYFRSVASADATATVEQQDKTEEKSSQRRSSRCIPLAMLNLSDIERRKIDRYLDVTKSAFLFGGRALLVEGIAEALLLPIIARRFVLKDNPQQLRLFRSAVFVPIDGVDFRPYVKLLLSPFNGVCIADRLVVMTDGDKTKADDGRASPGETRKTELESLTKDLGVSEFFAAVVNTYSLENELVTGGNGDLLKSVYLALHKNSEAKWDSAVAKTGDEQATAIQALFESTRKGDFAHLLAEKISEGAVFAVPTYIKAAIEALVK